MCRSRASVTAALATRTVLLLASFVASVAPPAAPILASGGCAVVSVEASLDSSAGDDHIPVTLSPGQTFNKSFGVPGVDGSATAQLLGSNGGCELRMSESLSTDGGVFTRDSGNTSPSPFFVDAFLTFSFDPRTSSIVNGFGDCTMDGAIPQHFRPGACGALKQSGGISQQVFGGVSCIQTGESAASCTIEASWGLGLAQGITIAPWSAASAFTEAVIDLLPVQAELALTLSATPTPVAVGSNLTYTLTVKNNSAARATGVIVTDTLDPSLPLLSATSTVGSCNPSSGPLGESRQVICAIGNLSGGGMATITVATATTVATTVTNRAVVAGNEFDPNSANNAATVTVVVRAVNDTVPPGTIASASPPPNSSGLNGGDVTIHLSATDTAQAGVNPSGVASINVRDGGTTLACPITGVNPASCSVTLTSPGTHAIQYFATDVAGNVETLHSLTIRLVRVVLAEVRVNQGVDVTSLTSSTPEPSNLIDVNEDGIPDLVALRPTIVRARLLVDDGGLLTDQTPVGLSVAFQSQLYLPERFADAPSGIITMADIRSAPGAFVDTFFSTANASPPSLLSVNADVSGITAVAQLPIDVKEVRDTQYIYFDVNYLGEPFDFQGTVNNSADYLPGVFPLPLGFHFINKPSGIPFIPGQVTPGHDGAVHDALLLWLQGKHLTISPTDRIIGITSSNWFSNHFPPPDAPIVGIAFDMVRSVAFVLGNGDPSTTAHELGHTYGLTDELFAPARGYWIQRRQPVSTAFSYMSAVPLGPAYPPASTSVWSTASDYQTVFGQLRASSSDPEVLLVTGTISKSGTVAVSQMYRLQSGTADTPPPGDGAIQLLDGTSNVLASVPFAVDFGVGVTSVGGATGPASLDPAPFAFAVPYPPNTSTVQVVRSGQVLAEVHPTSKLLHDVVTALPDSSFVRKPSQSRAALLSKIDALDQQISTRSPGAANKLRNDIRKSVVDWLLDNYAVASPLQYTKSQLLSLVDELIQRLAA